MATLIPNYVALIKKNAKKNSSSAPLNHSELLEVESKKLGFANYYNAVNEEKLKRNEIKTLIEKLIKDIHVTTKIKYEERIQKNKKFSFDLMLEYQDSSGCYHKLYMDFFKDEVGKQSCYTKSAFLIPYYIDYISLSDRWLEMSCNLIDTLNKKSLHINFFSELIKFWVYHANDFEFVVNQNAHAESVPEEAGLYSPFYIFPQIFPYNVQGVYIDAFHKASNQKGIYYFYKLSIKNKGINFEMLVFIGLNNYFIGHSESIVKTCTKIDFVDFELALLRSFIFRNFSLLTKNFKEIPTTNKSLVFSKKEDAYHYASTNNYTEGIPDGFLTKFPE